MCQPFAPFAHRSPCAAITERIQNNLFELPTLKPSYLEFCRPQREEAERQAKLARIEAKRLAAEARLTDMTAKRALELELEAERAAEELRRKDVR